MHKIPYVRQGDLFEATPFKFPCRTAKSGTPTHRTGRAANSPAASKTTPNGHSQQVTPQPWGITNDSIVFTSPSLAVTPQLLKFGPLATPPTKPYGVHGARVASKVPALGHLQGWRYAPRAGALVTWSGDGMASPSEAVTPTGSDLDIEQSLPAESFEMQF